MANYQNYPPNSTANGENNQFNVDLNQSKVLMLNNIMDGFNQANGTHLMNTNGNPVYYTLPASNFNFAQTLQNAFQPQYLNGLNNGVNNGLLQMTNNNHPVNLYINNPAQFNNGEGYINAMPQFIQVPNFAQPMVQADNEVNKGVQQRQTHSRKKSFADQIKSDSGEMEYDHKNRPLIYSCKECPRKFSMNSRLNTHMRCHNGERPHVCLQCNFAFTQKSYLVRHAAVHKEERPYQCHACKKTYKHYGSLANHRKTHKNGRNDMNESVDEENVDHQKLEPESATQDFQNQPYLFNEPLKQEPQHMSMATDLSTQYQTSDQTVSYLEQLNPYSQSGMFFNTDTPDVLATSQSSSNPTSTFTV